MFRYFFSKGTGKWQLFRDSPEELAKYVERAGGVDCYASLNVWPSPPLEDDLPCFYDYAFDFDCKESVADSALEARIVYDAFAETTGLQPSIYFSGSKGIHLLIRHEKAGISPRPDGGHLCKLLQEAIVEQEGLQYLDTGIHGQRRVLRIPNTRHGKTGLFKVVLDYAKLVSISQGEIFKPTQPGPQELVINREVNEAFAEMVSLYIPQADIDYAARLAAAAARPDANFKGLPACIRNIVDDPAIIPRQAKTWGKRVPTRNELTYAAATFLKNHRGLTRLEAGGLLGTDWQRKVAAISSSDEATIAASTSSALDSVYAGADEFSCGYVISRGCRCAPSCPLYKELPREEEQ